ncbi:hypothetical protein I7I49_00965 [Sinorhizobium meliloti]|uniref:hypothetical protein n=1 Tax=Rhizobium meliloti TaxID=382 RepID=UPI00237F0F62|nr:hypothetical protein [Sinorhizobium meliloti]MDE3808851.1 hypothetical protein [Sinorhizobium meliloti]
MDISLIFFASGVVFGGACAIIAANKNRDPLGWFALGFFFSIIALIVIAALSPAEKSSGDSRSKRRQGNGEFAPNPKDPERPWLG